MVHSPVADPINAQRLIYKTSLILACDSQPYDAFRYELMLRVDWKGELFQDVRSLKSPLLAFDSMLVCQFNRVGVEDVFGKQCANNCPGLVLAKGRNCTELGLGLRRDAIPVIKESFQRI